MAIKRKDIISSLMRKGFSLHEGGSHTILLFEHREARTAINTILSRGAKDIGKNLKSQMARQIHLSSGDFARLVECELSYEGFVEVLRTKGVLKPKAEDLDHTP